MFASTLSTLAILAVASVNGSPMPLEARDPQFSVNLPNRLPVNGNIGFGINIGTGTNGNSVVTIGNNTSGRGAFPFGFFGGGRFRGNTGTTTPTTNTTTNFRGRPFPFSFFPFKRDEEMEMMKRDPQFSFNFPNALPISGNLPFGINIGTGANGNSVGNFGNATTGTRPFPFNFLPFKREELEALVARQLDELEARGQIQKRDPQFSFNFPNRLPITGNLPFGINLGVGANGNSVGNFGNATTGTRPFPFSFLPFKRED